MPIGVVLLAPFYHPLLLTEQIGTLAAFAEGSPIATFVLGGGGTVAAAAGRLGDAWLTGQNAGDEGLGRQLDLYRAARAWGRRRPPR